MMTLTIKLPPELERRLTEEAAQRGQEAEEFVLAMLEERLATAPAAKPAEAQMDRNQRAIALLRQWSPEDAAQPDPDPVPDIPPLSPGGKVCLR
jgi:predicted transcriptional regulator